MPRSDFARAHLLALAAAMVLTGTRAAGADRNRQVVPAALTAPVLFATATSTTNVHLAWSNVPGATVYDIYRRTSGWSFQPHVTNLGGTSYAETVSANTAYYYFVRARNASETADSNIDLATTVVFTDDPIVAGETVVYGYHVTQLRSAINYARLSAGIGAASWTKNVLEQTLIETEEVEELRSALNQALSAVGMPVKSFTDSPLVKGVTEIKKVHAKELRQGVKGVQLGGLYTITYTNVSEQYFSPNADTVKDTTTVTAHSSSPDTSWTLTVKSVMGTPVRTSSAFGPILSYTWDGRSTAGAVQPDGPYTFSLSAVDGIYTTAVTMSVTLDITAPTASIASPTTGQVISNIRQNGSTSTNVTGTTADTNLLDWTAAAGPSGGSMTTFGSNTTAVSNAAVGTWNSGAAANGSYDLRLTVRDRAGNIAVATTAVTVGHFSASQNVYQLNTAIGETVTYTSIVPFPVTETLTIRNSAGITVRTLASASREAGTYNDPWNGRSDTGVLLPDGPYSYFVTITEGANVLTWDLSNEMRGASATQFPYPSCSAKTMPLDTCGNNAGRTYDLLANDPLKIHYTVGEPSRVSIVLTDAVETPGTCLGSEVCLVNGEYRPSGSYIESWSGVSQYGVYEPVRTKLTVVRRTSTFPKNVVLLYGSGAAVEIANLTLTPTIFGLESGSMKIEFDLATFGNAGSTVTLQMLRQHPASTLRTVTLPSQSPGHVTYTWDGKADSDHWVAPGEYALLVTATANGRSSIARSRFVVLY